LADFELQLPETNLRDPHAIAVHAEWENAGLVGDIVLGMVGHGLNATYMGGLQKPGRFYDHTLYPNRTRTHPDNVVNRDYSFPNSQVFYVRREAPLSDLVILHLLEPNYHWEDFEGQITGLVERLGVNRYVVVGGIPDAVPHTRPIIVSGRSDDVQLAEKLNQMGVRVSPEIEYEGDISMLSIMTGKIQSMGIATSSLMVRMPSYLNFLRGDYSGASRLIRSLMELEGINIPQDSLESLEHTGKRQYDIADQACVINPILAGLVRQLEVSYDANLGTSSSPHPFGISRN